MMVNLEERLRASVPTRNVDTQALTTAAMHRSEHRRQRQRTMFAVGCIAALSLAVWSLNTHNDADLDVDATAVASAPAASYLSPGEGFTVRTANGWALRVPDGWSIAERDLDCGTVIVAAVEPAGAEAVLDDSCQPITTRPPSQAALLLITIAAGDIDYPGPVTAATLPTGTSVALLDYDDDVAHAVVAALPEGTDPATVELLTTTAASVNVPGLDIGRSGSAEPTATARSGLDGISSTPGEPAPLLLGPDTAGLRAATASLVAHDEGWVSLVITLEDPPGVSPGAGRILALCQARNGPVGGTCAPRGATTDVVLAGTTFSCDEQLRCTRTSEDGSTLGFHPLRGLFETSELDTIIEGLRSR